MGDALSAVQGARGLVNGAVVVVVPARRTALLSPAWEGGVRGRCGPCRPLCCSAMAQSLCAVPSPVPPAHLPRWPFLSAARPQGAEARGGDGAGPHPTPAGPSGRCAAGVL